MPARCPRTTRWHCETVWTLCVISAPASQARATPHRPGASSQPRNMGGLHGHPRLWVSKGCSQKKAQLPRD